MLVDFQMQEMSVPYELRSMIGSYNRDSGSFALFSLDELIDEAIDLGIDLRYIINKEIVKKHVCNNLRNRLKGTLAEMLTKRIYNHPYSMNFHNEQLIIEMDEISNIEYDRYISSLNGSHQGYHIVALFDEKGYIDCNQIGDRFSDITNTDCSMGTVIVSISGPNIHTLQNDIQSLLESCI